MVTLITFNTLGDFSSNRQEKDILHIFLLGLLLKCYFDDSHVVFVNNFVNINCKIYNSCDYTVLAMGTLLAFH